MSKPQRRGRRPVPKQTQDSHQPDGVRLQKVLASAGVGSRRVSEGLIAAGHVTVNGELVTELGTRVDPATAVIHVKGMRVSIDDHEVTLILNKPRGVITALKDPEGRRTVADLLDSRIPGLTHVGRLDADSEGLLIMTNNGELAHRLTHPSYLVTKRYLVNVQGRLSGTVAQQLRSGVELEDGSAAFTSLRVVDQLADETLIEVELHEGRNRIVRRMFDHVGLPVKRLVRTRIASLNLGHLRPGQVRVLSKQDAARLMREVGL